MERYFVSQSPPLTHLTEFLKSLLDKYAPVTRKKVRSHRSSPWFASLSKQLLDLKRQRRRAERRWLKSGLTVDRQIFSRLKQQVTKLSQQAKTAYYSAKICASATCREFFLNVNTLLGKAKPSTFPTTYTEEELPGVFSDFFQSKIIAIRNNLDRVASSPSSAEPGEFSGCPLVEFRPVSQEFVRDLLKRTPPKSCELDSMPTTLMYECMDVLLPSLMQIINESLTVSVFPPDFKMAIVKPQLKKLNLDPNNLKNYRPISNYHSCPNYWKRLFFVNLKIT